MSFTSVTDTDSVVVADRPPPSVTTTSSTNVDMAAVSKSIARDRVTVPFPSIPNGAAVVKVYLISDRTPVSVS